MPDNIDVHSLVPSPDQLKRELLCLVRDRRSWQLSRLGLRDAREMLFELVDEQDIEAFISKVWPKG